MSCSTKSLGRDSWKVVGDIFFDQPDLQRRILELYCEIEELRGLRLVGQVYWIVRIRRAFEHDFLGLAVDFC